MNLFICLYSWGVHDIEDACAGALYMADVKKASHKDKLLISGGSAGGYTGLACLTFRSDFKTGASHYGISDLAVLAQETHKFESKYCDTMIAPYPDQAYIDRSPIHHLDQFESPCAIFQGALDNVSILIKSTESFI